MKVSTTSAKKSPQELAARLKTFLQAAKDSADFLVRARGKVTSTEVLEDLRGLGYNVDSVDKRFMGAVFREGYVRAGWAPTGSHNRPVTVWKKK